MLFCGTSGLYHTAVSKNASRERREQHTSTQCFRLDVRSGDITRLRIRRPPGSAFSADSNPGPQPPAGGQVAGVPVQVLAEIPRLSAPEGRRGQVPAGNVTAGL